VRARKTQVRLLVRDRLRAMTRTDREQADAHICDRLAGIASARVAFVVGYLALPDEVDIGHFMKEWIACGRRVYAPRVHAGCLAFARWTPGSRVSRDEKGVLAPESSEFESLPDEQGTILVPGRAFDAAGVRLGRGGGYYDRALSTLGPALARVGVSYDCQIFEELPREQHDETVEMVVTETCVTNAARAKKDVQR